jgi:hypothetical protein
MLIEPIAPLFRLYFNLLLITTLPTTAFLYIMTLQELSRDKLTDRLLAVHDSYQRATCLTLAEYIQDPGFLRIRDELNELLNELKRRREQELSIRSILS